MDSLPASSTTKSPSDWSVRFWLPLLLLITVAAGIRNLALNENLFHDEVALASNTIDRSYWGLFGPLDHDQVAPPLFLVISKVMASLLGTEGWVFRLFPWLASVAILPFIFVLGRRLGGPFVGVISVSMYALLDPPARLALLYKQYQVEALVAVVLCWLATGWLERIKRQGEWRATGIVVAGLIAPWISLTSIFVLASIVPAALLSAPRRAVKQLATIAAIGAAWLLSFGIQHTLFRPTDATSTFMRNFWQHYFAPLPPKSQADVFWYVDGFFRLFSDLATMRLEWASGVAALAFLLCLVTFARSRLPMVLLLVGPLFLALVASSLKLYPFYGRFQAFEMPLLVMACGLGLDLMRQQSRSLAVIAVVLLLSQPMVLTASRLLKPGSHHPDMRGVVRYLHDHAQEGDVVLLDRNGATLNLDYFARSMPLPKMERHVLDADHPIESYRGAKRLWVLYWFVSPDPLADQQAVEEGERRMAGQAQLQDKLASTGVTLLLYDFSTP